jgi:hypothetical protein
VANEADLVKQLRLHQECWELLPWVVNDRLSSGDAAIVSQHLTECTRCSEELQFQRQLCDTIQRDHPVLLAPQASLKKLWHRIDSEPPPGAAVEGNAPRWHTNNVEQSLQMQGWTQDCEPVSLPAAHASDSQPSLHRMKVALAAQAATIFLLVAWMGWQTYERWQAPLYYTVTAHPETTPQQPAVRVVFVDGIPMQDAVELLRAVDAQILAGPSQAGVFTLGLPAHATDESAARIAIALSTDPRVQFAESIAPDREAQ